MGHCCEYKELSKVRPEIKDIISPSLSSPCFGLVPLEINGDCEDDEVVLCCPEIFLSTASSPFTTTASGTPGLPKASKSQDFACTTSKTCIQNETIRPSKAAGVNYDGAIFFPTFGVAVYPSFLYLDTCSLAAQEEQQVPGVPHCVIRPDDAVRLKGTIKGNGVADLAVQFRTTLDYVNPVSKQSISLRMRFMIVNSLTEALPWERGSNITTVKELQQYSFFMSDRKMSAERRRYNTDVVLLLGQPQHNISPNGDMHLLNMRWLCYDTLSIACSPHNPRNGSTINQHDFQRNMLYRYIQEHMRHDGYSVIRRGGSNGTSSSMANSASAYENFHRYLHQPGMLHLLAVLC